MALKNVKTNVKRKCCFQKNKFKISAWKMSIREINVKIALKFARGGNSCFGSWCFLVLFGFHLVSFGFFWCCLVFIWLFLVLFGVHLAFFWCYLAFIWLFLVSFVFDINFLKFHFWLKFLKKSLFLEHKV